MNKFNIKHQSNNKTTDESISPLFDDNSSNNNSDDDKITTTEELSDQTDQTLTTATNLNQNQGFAAFYCQPYISLLNLDQYNMFKIKLKTDNNSYIFNCHIENYFFEPIYQGKLSKNNLPINQIIQPKIKFKNLLQTINGYAITNQELFNGQHIKRLGFGIKGTGPFKLEIYSIQALRDSGGEEQERPESNS